MPRKLELTFQHGANGRTGRWKKYYRGKNHYLGNGRCKSDFESYQAALVKWKKLKTACDAELIERPNPLQKQYDEVIEEWELVLGWALQNREDDEASCARDKVKELRLRRQKRSPSPITHWDRLWSRFRPEKKVLEQLGDLIAQKSKGGWAEFQDAMMKSKWSPGKFPRHTIDCDVLSKQDTIWQDRLEQQKKLTSLDCGNSLGSWQAAYLAGQRQRVEADELSPARFVAVRATLGHFCDWAGKATAVASLNGQTLTRFHASQLELIAKEQCSAAYARDRMTTVRSFIRWLWGQEAIEHLPRNIELKELRISRQSKTPETLSIDRVKELLQVATGRTQLYILLGLNCGMTQKDIADLQQTQVSWDQGTISRKRSKTQSHKGVPTVTYKLWPETIRLLTEFRSNADVVLLNQNGGRLLVDRVDSSGHYTKSDNIKSAYSRLLQKLSFSKPFKLLRKTSATLINSDERFRGLDQLFLGHAPATMAEKHYTVASRSALDGALSYLRNAYGLGHD